MDNLQEIRTRCDVLLAAASISNDKERIDSLIEVKHFLEDDNCFINADSMVSKFAMLRLGYDFKQVNEIYDSFNKIEILPGVLEYKDSDGNIVQIEAMLSPKVEDYYKFTNGLIFKLDNRKQQFYSLINGEWVYDAELQRKFYDVGYDYESIGYKIIKKDSLRR